MKKLVCFLALAILANSPSAFASSDDCQADLAPQTLSLPRELKVSEGAAQYLLAQPEHAPLLKSLSRIFLAIHNPDLDLNDIGADLAENSDRFAVLQESPLGRVLNSDDLELLARFWRNTPTNARNQELVLTLETRDVIEQVKFKVSRLQFLLTLPQFRRAIIALIGDQHGRAYYLKLFNLATEIPPSMRGYFHPDNLDQLAKDVSRGKSVSREGLMTIQQFLGAFALDISQYANKTLELRASSMNGLVMTYHRDDFLNGLTPYFAEKFHLKSQLNDISSLIDHYLFGSALPWNAQKLRQIALDEAKTMLLPLKSEYTGHQAKVNQQLTSAKTISSTPFYLNFIDHFEPKSSPHIRRRFDDKKSSAAEASVDLEASIAPEEALRPFTSFAIEKRDILEIIPFKTYRFWFLRDNEPREQKMRLSEEACAWIKLHPESGTQILNALHLGRARTVGQSGLKILTFYASSRYDGPIFELKTSNSIRGLLINTNGVWELLAITTKDDLIRDVNSLAPLL